MADVIGGLDPPTTQPIGTQMRCPATAQGSTKSTKWNRPTGAALLRGSMPWQTRNSGVLFRTLVAVVGQDHYRVDGNNDGQACIS